MCLFVCLFVLCVCCHYNDITIILSRIIIIVFFFYLYIYFYIFQILGLSKHYFVEVSKGKAIEFR